MKEDRIDQRGDFYEKKRVDGEKQRERGGDIHARGKYWSVRANSWTLTFAPSYQNHVSPSCSAPLRHWSIPKPTNSRRRRKCFTGIDYEPGHRPPFVYYGRTRVVPSIFVNSIHVRGSCWLNYFLTIIVEWRQKCGRRIVNC